MSGDNGVRELARLDVSIAATEPERAAAFRLEVAAAIRTLARKYRRSSWQVRGVIERISVEFGYK